MRDFEREDREDRDNLPLRGLNAKAQRREGAKVAVLLLALVVLQIPGFGALDNELRKVSSIAELKALPKPTTTNMVTVAGYYAPGDGGEMQVYFAASSSATEDGGRVFAPNAGGTGRWLSASTPSFNDVRKWGAKGDGSTDDSAAIQAAINNLTSGGQMYFPPGTYDIATGLTFTASDNIAVLGDEGKTTIEYTGSGTAVTVSATSGNRRKDITFRGIKITKKTVTWTDGTDVSSIGLKLQNTYRFNYDGVYITGFWHGIDMIGTGSVGCVYSRFRISSLTNNRINAYLTAASGGWCNDNLFEGGSWSTTSVTVAGIHVDLVFGGAGVSGNIFSWCDFEGDAQPGIRIGSGVTNVRIEKCRLENTSSGPYAIDSAGSGISLEQNLISYNSTDVYIRSGAGGHTFTDNNAFTFLDDNIPSVCFGQTTTLQTQPLNAQLVGGNLMQDGGMEHGYTPATVSGHSIGTLPQGWEWSFGSWGSSGAVATLDASVFEEGVTALKIVNTDATGLRCGFKIQNLVSGQRYSCRFLYKMTSVQATDLRFSVGSTMSLVEDLNLTTLVTDDTWRSARISFTATGTSRYIYLKFQFIDAFTFYIDGLGVYQGQNVAQTWQPMMITEEGGTIIGALAAKSTLAVTGAISGASTADFTGALSAAGITGTALTVNGAANVTGQATLGAGAAVTGLSALNGMTLMGGGLNINRKTKSSNYTLTTNDFYIYATGGTMTLPAIGAATNIFVIKSAPGVTTPIARSGSDTIDAATSDSVGPGASKTYISDTVSNYEVN
jgi:hypothetical protein